jgi:FkbM family methyltransferase
MSLLGRLAVDAKRAFYNARGPWYRCRLFEMFGSRRYSHPALYGMDRRLSEIISDSGGTFFEAGAHDGYTQSNTYYLERFCGWSGILVEPIGELRALSARRRPRAQVVGCALVGRAFASDTVELEFGDLMSVISGSPGHAEQGLRVTGRKGYRASVPARTISDLIDKHASAPIDLMVLDLEGHELEALSGLDMDRHAPRYLLVETLDRETQQQQFDAALVEHYEFVDAISEFDLLYRRRGA